MQPFGTDTPRRSPAHRTGGWLAWLWSGIVLATTAHADTGPGAPPGRLVDIGTHRLHLDCQGRGTPVVLFESGIGGFSIEWRTLAAGLAGRQRVCSYDRAGYGWSDAGPMPRTAARSAAELLVLLERAQEQGPFVLVAHSYGAYIARILVATDPDRIAALIFLDPATPEQFSRLPAWALPPATVRSGARIVSVPRLPAGLAEDAQTLALQLMLLPNARLARASELEWFRLSARQVLDAEPWHPRAPIVVVSRGRNEFGPSSQARAAEALWQQLHADYARGSGAARVRLERAGHLAHLDAPEAVARIIRAGSQAARHHTNIGTQLTAIGVPLAPPTTSTVAAVLPAGGLPDMVESFAP